MDDDADQEVDHARNQNSAVREVVMPGAAALDGKHGAQEGERRAEVAGHLSAGDEQEDEGRDSAEEDHCVRVEAKDQRNEHCGPEHRHHVLQAHEDGLRPRQTVLGIDDAALSRSS